MNLTGQRWVRNGLATAVWLALALGAGCQQDTEAITSVSESVAEFKASTKQKLLETLARDRTLPGISIRIIAPSVDLDWGTAVGYADADHSVPFTSAHPIRISSVTKPFVAAAILRLHEQGTVDLDAPITHYLKETHIELLRQGPYAPEEMTVRHLLTHTSGIMDTFNTRSFMDYAASVVAGGEPRSFTLEDQVLAAVEGGGPTGAPGERQQYTDTGYILLGAILEELTGKSMAAATRTLSRYGEFDLGSTWWEIFEPPPRGALPRALQYLGDFPADGFGDEPFDLFGGGGMISSADDLARYFWALFHGDVFEDATTLDVMRSKYLPEVIEGDSELLVRHGLQAFEINGNILYGHHGWWGVAVYYSPEADVLMAINWLQQLSGEQVGALGRGIVAEAIRLSQPQAD